MIFAFGLLGRLGLGVGSVGSFLSKLIALVEHVFASKVVQELIRAFNLLVGESLTKSAVLGETQDDNSLHEVINEIKSGVSFFVE